MNPPKAQLSPEQLFERGVATLKDLLAPSALEFSQNTIKVGERYARTLFAFSYPRYLTSNWLAPIVNLDQTMDLVIFAHPVETGQILRKMEKKVAEVESQMMTREERGLV